MCDMAEVLRVCVLLRQGDQTQARRSANAGGKRPRLQHEVIRDGPDGIEAQLYARASADLASGNFSSQDVSWWYPTCQIKTFHPRTPGMYAYRDAVIKKIKEVGQW
ncbi:hypothetical protein VTI74DRAFT_9220 [Chaetomium olivicolor]